MSGRRGAERQRQQGAGSQVRGGVAGRRPQQSSRLGEGSSADRRGNAWLCPSSGGTKRRKRKCMSERSGGRASCRRRELLDCFGGGRLGLIPRVSWPGSDTKVSGPGQFACLIAPLSLMASLASSLRAGSFVASGETEKRVSPDTPALAGAQRRCVQVVAPERSKGARSWPRSLTHDRRCASQSAGADRETRFPFTIRDLRGDHGRSGARSEACRAKLSGRQEHVRP
jgi:hypothetical protein